MSNFLQERAGNAGSGIPLLELIIRGGNVQRFHTRDTIKPNTVAHHSWGVAWFCYMLSEGKPSAALLLHAIAHDLPEGIVGDPPAPTKRLPGVAESLEDLEQDVLAEAGLDALPGLTVEERRMLKLADSLDGLLYCALEARRGNMLRTEYYNYLSKMVQTRLECEILNAVIRVYNQALFRDINYLSYKEIHEYV